MKIRILNCGSKEALKKLMNLAWTNMMVPLGKIYNKLTMGTC